MTDLKHMTNLILYGSMVVVLLCGALTLRTVQLHDEDIESRQLGMRGDIRKVPRARKLRRVQGPALTPDGDNLGISLDTDSKVVWRGVGSEGTAPVTPRLIPRDVCAQKGWSECSGPVRWVTAPDTIYAVLFTLKRDDLITISGNYRTGSDSIRVLQNKVTGGWQAASVALRRATVVDYKETSPNRSREMHHSFSLESGTHIIGLDCKSVLWFAGSLSSTLAGNLQIYM